MSNLTYNRTTTLSSGCFCRVCCAERVCSHHLRLILRPDDRYAPWQPPTGRRVELRRAVAAAAAVRPSFLVFVARDGTCLPAHHGLLSSQRHWPHAGVGIGNALVGDGLRHHHRRRRVKRLSVQSCKCARKASGCSRGAPSRSRCAVCTRSRVTVQTKARSGSFHGAAAVGVRR